MSRRARPDRWMIGAMLLLGTGVPVSVPAQAVTTVVLGRLTVPIPPSAEVVRHPRGRSRLGGVRIRLEERLTLELAALPASPLSLERYTDSIAEARNATARPGRRLPAPEPHPMAGGTAWVLHPACGDCEAIEAYLDLPGMRVVAAWGVDGLGAISARERHALAWRFLDTLRPVAEQARTGTSPASGP